MANRRKFSKKKCSSRYKGVTYRKQAQQWQAYIYINKQFVHLGLCKTEEEAARLYDAAAREFFDEFACLNFPD